MSFLYLSKKEFTISVNWTLNHSKVSSALTNWATKALVYDKIKHHIPHLGMWLPKCGNRGPNVATSLLLPSHHHQHWWCNPSTTTIKCLPQHNSDNDGGQVVPSPGEVLAVPPYSCRNLVIPLEWNLAEGPAKLFIPVSSIPLEFQWIPEFTPECSPE